MPRAKQKNRKRTTQSSRRGRAGRAGKPQPATPPLGTPVVAPGFANPVSVNQPVFGDPTPSSDPTQFLDQKSDVGFYKLLNKSLLQPVPPPRDTTRFPDKLTITLAEALGDVGASRIQKIQQAGRIVFHAVGDTGPTKGPANVVLVADKMATDFNEINGADVPSFFFHLGDVVYNFGEDEYYYDQFYEPFRNYPAPIFAIPGNHDGVTYKGDPAATLAAFLRNFCSPTWQKPPEAGSLSRTTMTQPAVYFALDAPFVCIIGLYSNVLEGPGVLSSQGDSNSPVKDDQLVFLKSQMDALKSKNYKGAVIVAVHHPPYTAGSVHGGSPHMLTDMDNVFQRSGFYPHAVLSGHAHNYQRFTRALGGRQIPYIIAGSGGHNANPLRQGKNATPIRTPLDMGNVRLENYSEHFGYLRVVVTKTVLSLEYHEVGTSSDSKSPIDVVTVDLASHTLTTTRP